MKRAHPNRTQSTSPAQNPSAPDAKLGELETLLAMAAVDPDFARALATRRDDALAASGVALSPEERRILEATPAQSLQQMSASLVRRIPASSRRTFLRRAGQSLALLAGTTLLAGDGLAAPPVTGKTPAMQPPQPAPQRAGQSRVWWEHGQPSVGLSGRRGTGSRPDRRRPRSKVRGRVWLRSVKTKGPLSRSIVRRVMRRHLARIRYYYEVALIKRPKLKGELRVEFVITAAGKVTVARMVSSTLRAPTLRKRILGAIRTWRFPMPGRVASTTVSATFRFRPKK